MKIRVRTTRAYAAALVLANAFPALASSSDVWVGVEAATPSFAAVVERSRATAYDGRPLALAVTVRAYRGEAPKYVAIVAQPGADVKAAPVRVNLREVAPGRFAGALTLGVRGAWTLGVRIARAHAPAEIARVPLRVTAAGAPPRWTGWFIALLPLVVCAAFARQTWRRAVLGPADARTLFTRA